MEMGYPENGVTKRVFEAVTMIRGRILQMMQAPGFIILALTLWMVCILFYRLGDLSLDPDEGNILKWSTEVYKKAPTIPALISHAIQERGFYQAKEYPGLNIFINAAFFQWFGASVWTARLVSALLALGIIPFFFLLARRLFQQTAPALTGAVIIATSAPMLFLMRQCRYTSLTMLATLCLIWAYLNVLDRKKYSPIHMGGAVLLFFFTAFHIFLPVLIGITLHALWYYRGYRRGAITGSLILFAIGISWIVPDNLVSGPSWYFSFYQQLQAIEPITVLHKLHVYFLEFNFICMPISFILVYILLFRKRWNRYFVLIMGTVCGGVILALSPAGNILLKDVFGVLLDMVWPSFSPWWFNRLVDPRSWLALLCCIGVVVLFLRVEKSSFHPVLLLLTIMMGAVIAYCIVPQYRIPWTRYLASTFVCGFLIAGYLTAQIMEKHRTLGMAMIGLHMTSNILSVVPFVPGHYPYFQWKLPQFIYRLFTGDNINEIITNFIRIPPL